MSSTAAPRPALHQQTFLEKDILPGSDRRCDSHKESAESSSCETLQRESAYHCFRGSWSCHIVQVQECWPNIAQDGLSECGKLQHTTSMAACESHTGHERDPHDQSTQWHPSCTHCLWSERVRPAQQADQDGRHHLYQQQAYTQVMARRQCTVRWCATRLM